MSEKNEVNSQIEEDEKIILEEMKKIEELDASIYDLELQIKKGNEDLSKEQVKNRERLRDMLSSAPPECGVLSKNTAKFLDLHKIEDSGADPEEINMTDEEKERINDLLEDFSDDKESSPYFINEEMQNILNTDYKDNSN
ncbi:uncharacterized protein LOC107035996 [Diachasma alloeum]|uniref:uncharacterized protein LOC107035996 n=1 Tax=Diachasma alloeum TaxID=454923 RepID=UPI0007382650|nr:uncharacterized protein LOC107035996 [Diachasma alloeum]